jgi:mono/diheme cytochrome c family protein
MKKLIYLLSVILTSFLFLSNTFADDCVQKRKTPQAPNNILKQTNPLETTTENIAAGEMLFIKGAKPLACAQCHGLRGKGDGTMARGMNPKPRDFSCQTMMKDIPDGQLFWIIKNGSKGTGMMGFKMLKDDQIWQLVSYIRKFTK